MTAFQMFKSAKVKRLELELEAMTEARDAVAAASKFLRDRCDMQTAALLYIIKFGESNPTWAVRMAKAVLEAE